MGVSHVPDVGLAARGALNSARASAAGARQSTNEVLMVAPTAFGFNDQVRCCIVADFSVAAFLSGRRLRDSGPLGLVERRDQAESTHTHKGRSKEEVGGFAGDDRSYMIGRS